MATQRRTSKATKATSASTVQSITLSIDVGNHAIKAMSGQMDEPTVIRSIYAPVPIGTTNIQRHSNESPLVIMADGKGRYHFGDMATRYETTMAICEEDKTNPAIYIPAVLSVLRPLDEQHCYNVKLNLSAPNLERDGEKIKDAVMGKQFNAVVNGNQLLVNVESVELFYEGEGAYRYANSLGMIPDEGRTLIIDVGGKTANALLFDDDGSRVGEPYTKAGMGCIALAAMIADDFRLTSKTGERGDVAIIMNGLADGSHRYGRKAYGWGDWWMAHRDIWFKKLLGEIHARFSSQMPYITSILFTGGSSYLFADKLEGIEMMDVIENPELANVLGMAETE